MSHSARNRKVGFRFTCVFRQAARHACDRWRHNSDQSIKDNKFQIPSQWSISTGNLVLPRSTCEQVNRHSDHSIRGKGNAGFPMKTKHSASNHKDRLSLAIPIPHVLTAILAASITTFASQLYAQRDAPHLMAADLPGQNTISANQLLTPSKALKATEHARRHLLAGQIEQAQKEVEHALGISPHCALALNIQGAIHLEKRQFTEAAADFHWATDADPALGSAYLGLAMSLIAQERLEDALAPLNRATSLLPGSWLIYFESALTHLGLGDTEAALKQISYAERFNEMNAERKSGTAYMRGMIYINLKDFVRAKKYLEFAVASDPNGVYAAFALRRLDNLGPIPTSAN
jgi:tetratricopeptide (TPR) repeat protein